MLSLSGFARSTTGKESRGQNQAASITIKGSRQCPTKYIVSNLDRWHERVFLIERCDMDGDKVNKVP